MSFSYLEPVRQFVKLGDLVICNCAAAMLVGFDHFGAFNQEKGDPLVMFSGEVVRLTGASLEVLK